MKLVSRVPGAAELAPKRHRRTRRAIDVSLGVGIPIALLLLWQLASSRHWIDDRLYPSPTDVGSKAVDMWRDGQLWDHIWVSIRRLLLGYGFGALAGVVAGLVMGMFRVARVAFEPLLNGLYTVPKLALISVFYIILGFGEAPIIAVIAVTVFFFVWISTMAAILAVDPGYREAARSLDVDRAQMFRHVLVPAALPQIFVGLRIAAGVGVLVLIGVEFVIANEGVGHLIEQGRVLRLIDQMYLGIVVSALMGVTFIALVRFVGSLCTPWASDDTTRDRI